MTAKVTCGMFQMFLRPGRRRCEDANARIKDAKPGRRTILVLINYSSRPNLGSDLAHSILLDLKILRERDERNSLAARKPGTEGLNSKILDRDDRAGTRLAANCERLPPPIFHCIIPKRIIGWRPQFPALLTGVNHSCTCIA